MSFCSQFSIIFADSDKDETLWNSSLNSCSFFSTDNSFFYKPFAIYPLAMNTAFRKTSEKYLQERGLPN
jgi:hypothetical protein